MPRAERRPPIVEVEWEDAANNPRWLTPDEVLHAVHLHPFIAHSVGYVIHDDKTAMTLAEGINSEGWYGACWRIPRGMIRKVRKLR